MFGSSMLDIAIGIIFIFLLLSIFATAINEIILSLIKMRGKMLFRGIKTLLDDDAATGLVDRVYNHGQVCGLFKGDFDPKDISNLPSYIPSRNFALALIGVVEQLPADFKEAAELQQKAKAEGIPVEAVNVAKTAEQVFLDAHAAVKTKADAVQAAAMLRATAAAQVKEAAQVKGADPAEAKPTAVPDIVSITQDFKVGAEMLAAHKITQKVGKPLVAMTAMAGDDARKLQQAVEDWYNSGMDRVSGWYKYHTQKVLLAIGLVMAVLLNANSIGIVRQLSNDPTMRQAIVAAAQSAKQPQTANPAPATDPSQTKTAPDPGIAGQMNAARKAFSSINDLGLPLGWPNGAPRAVTGIFTQPGRHAWSLLLFRTHPWEVLLGWLLTAIAISLGAPFWFDMLNKIMVIRSTVKPQEKSKDEPSKS